MDTDLTAFPSGGKPRISKSPPDIGMDWLRVDLLGGETTEILSPEGDPPPAATLMLPLPDFECLGILGRGGMGVVYHARQRSLNREVALKMLTHLGAAEPRVRARFQAEGEMLARLQHPNIVPVYQAGVHDETPYLVMEYVAGGSLEQQLRRELPPVRQAVELLETVTRAVHFAHDRGILHRDLKPGNILLTPEGQPRVADFGIARDLEATSNLTQTGEVMGTPAYLAPEQLQGATTLTVAVDVYSLGVILHQVLTGVVPFAGDSMPAVLMQVLAREPLPLQTWNLELPRDLDTICRKCLRKEPEQRYRTAGELADDLRRFLDGKPITARPVNWWEKSRRWCRRHPATAGLSAALVVVMLAALAGLTWGLMAFTGLNRELEKANADLTESNRALEEARQTAESRRQESESEKHRSEQTLEFLVAAFRRPDPNQDGKHLTVFDMLGKAWKDLAARKTLDPRTRWAMMLAIGKTYLGLVEDAEAVKVLEPAARLAETHLGRDHPDTLTTHHYLAAAYRAAGRYQDSLVLYEQVRDARTRQNGPDHPATLVTLHNLAGIYLKVRRHAEAIALYERVRDRQVEILGPHHPDTLITANGLAGAYLSTGRTGNAIDLYEQVLRKYAEIHGLDNPTTMTMLNNLAVAYRGVGRTAEAIPLYEQVRDLRLNKLGVDHPHTHLTLQDLGRAYRDVGRLAEAIAAFEQVRDERLKKPGPEHWNTLHTLNELGTTYRLAGRTAEAIALHERVLEVRLRGIGPAHPHTLLTKCELAASYLAASRNEAALELLDQVFSARQTVTNPSHPDVLQVFRRLATDYERLGQIGRQETLLRDYHQYQVKKYGEKSLTASFSGAHLAACLVAQHEYATAELLLRNSLTIQKAKQPSTWMTFRTQSLLGASLAGQKKYAEADPILREGYQGLKEHAERIPKTQRAVTLRTAAERVLQCYRATGQAKEAERWRREWEQWAEPSSAK